MAGERGSEKIFDVYFVVPTKVMVELSDPAHRVMVQCALLHGFNFLSCYVFDPIPFGRF